MMQIKGIQITGQYKLDSKVLSPSSTTASKPFTCLIICTSKFEGRHDYLAAKVKGDYKPQFISSIYEARTKEGWFNFEMKGVRYEVVKIDDAQVKIYEYNSAEKGVTFE